MTKQKIEMQRHLDKLKKCELKDPHNIYHEDDLYKRSLIKQEIIISKKEDISPDQLENYCEKCNKYFYNKSNLKKHQKNVCEKSAETQPQNIQNIGIQNITNNNQKIVHININYLKGFDEDWDVSKIDNSTKGEILLSNTKFSKTLENILKNDANLNVILNENETGVVYKNHKNKYEPMTKKEIIEKSMEKVYKHLKDFYEEIIKNNIHDLSELALKNELQELEKKYSKFFKLEEAQNIVKNSFTTIYNKKKEDAENKFYNLLENNIDEY